MKFKKSYLNCILMCSLGTVSHLTLNAGRKEVPVIQHEPDAQMNSLLKESGGIFNSKIRSHYLSKAKSSVLHQLKQQGKTINTSLIKWIDSDSTCYDAVYGTVCPPDPDILINLNQLWEEQGAAFTVKYKHLSLAASVARRGIGVDSLSSFSKFGAMANLAAEAKAENLSLKQYLAIRDKEKFEKRISLKRPITANDKKAYDLVRNYIKSQKITIYDLYVDKEKLSEVENILQTNGSKKKATHCLMHILVTDGSRKEKRTEFPKVSDYFKFLTKIHSIPADKLPLTENQRWPLFPATTAPWPLVMPLTRTMPMDEVKFIWDKFNGKADQEAKRRVHSYGPYRKGEKATKGKFLDLPWHWSAWPAVIKQGGICGTMSTISQGTATALGRPILKGAQPRHSCTVGYGYAGNGKYIASVGQSATAGPDGTGTVWLFRDGAAWNLYRHNTNAVHHYGLAQSMNMGLRSYMDSRIALHIYRSLSSKGKNYVGRKLLYSVLKKNPYNTEVWFTLAHDANSAKQTLEVFNFADQLLANNEAVEEVKLQAADEAIAGAEEENFKDKNIGKNAATYHMLMKRLMVKNAFADTEKFKKSDQKIIFNFLKEIGTTKDKEINLARDRFESAVIGYNKYMAEVEEGIKLSLKDPTNKKEEKATKKAQTEMKKKLEQVNNIITDRAEREAWLMKLINTYSAEKAAEANKKGKAKLSPAFSVLINSLNKSYKEAPANKSGVKSLNLLKKKFKLAVESKEEESADSDSDVNSKKKTKKKKQKDSKKNKA